MVGDEGAESLLAKIDALIEFVEHSGSRNGGKARKATLKEVRKHLRHFQQTKSISDLSIASEQLSDFVMGER